jgi:hypothetical protein
VKQQPQHYFEDALPASPPPNSPPIRKLLLEKIQECEEQAEYSTALESKISKLEELMKLKDAKIVKLNGRRSTG